ncbi:MAG TPA: hypothetical protein VM779_10385 [Thermoanaerobaculia bacterium]|nr:hypothetical protein [Thermoanaerobaculia bacterium]
MSKSRFFVVATTVVLAIGAIGCGENAAETEPATATETAPAAGTDTGEVAFEPAYPEDVSTEQLTAEDKAQQETHKHGDGEEHSHDEKTDTKAGHGHPH